MTLNFNPVPSASDDELADAHYDMLRACRVEFSEWIARIVGDTDAQSVIATLQRGIDELASDADLTMTDLKGIDAVHDLAMARLKVTRLWEALQAEMDCDPDVYLSVENAAVLVGIADNTPFGSREFVKQCFTPMFEPTNPAFHKPEYQRWLALYKK